MADTDDSGSMDQLTLMYYSADWQLLEERVDENSSFPSSIDPDTLLGAGDDAYQTIWGGRYIDDIIARRHNDVGNSIPDGYDHTYYHLTDVQFSTVAVVEDSAADLMERVAYDPYGTARHQFKRDVDGDGDVDGTDSTLISNANESFIDGSGHKTYNVDADFNRDGTVNASDAFGVGSATALVS
jgi:hypothetical protein